MTKSEAREALRRGCKVEHQAFLDDEWIRQEGLVIFTEEGYEILAEDFFNLRQHSGFDDGWSIIEEPKHPSDYWSEEERLIVEKMLEELSKDFVFKKPMGNESHVKPIIIGGPGAGLSAAVELGKCLNCKYWFSITGDLGLCNGIETSRYYEQQEELAQISYNPEGNNEFGINYNEFQLTTRANFGCVNFEEE